MVIDLQTGVVAVSVRKSAGPELEAVGMALAGRGAAQQNTKVQ